jgi:hypothetical protein
VGYNSTVGTNAVAVGASANASSSQSVVVGRQSSASASNAISIGYNNACSGANSVVIGTSITLSTANTIQLGTSSETVRFNTLKPISDTSDLTVGSGSTGNITFNISATNPLRIGTTTPMVNFQSSWYVLQPVINKTVQSMIVNELILATGLTRTYYRFPINFIPRFFTARVEDLGTFTGTGVSVRFTVYKNNDTSDKLGDSGALSGTFASAVSSDGSNDAIYIGLTLDYTTLTALNRSFYITFYGQQTP